MNYAIDTDSFALVSFDLDDKPPISIAGAISKSEHRLNVKYSLTGDLSTIIIPEVADKKLRRYDLWEHTCFEFFLKLKGTNKYWEFNLSPSGNWNVFRFLDYRLNIAEEDAFESFPFEVFQDIDNLEIEVNLDLNKLNLADKDLEIAVTTVVENKERQLSYWALKHPMTEADFHHPDGFVINI